MHKNAAIYIADPSMIGSHLLNSFDVIKSYKYLSKDKDATGICLKMKWGKVKLNFMQNDKLERHINGFSDYARSVISDIDRSIYTQTRIHHVRMCIGCVIQYSEVVVQEVHNFLFALNAALNGLLFLNDSIFDWSGEKLDDP